MSEIHRAHVADIDPVALYRILWLRVSVFVVEQQAAYPEIDGRDLEPGAELMWIVEDDEVLATLRILCGDEAMRIGRVATARAARGRGLAARLIEAAIERCAHLARDLPIDLDAQLQLEQWYGRFGFVRTGDAYQEDGIPHIPMRRPAGEGPDEGRPAGEGPDEGRPAGDGPDEGRPAGEGPVAETGATGADA